MDSPQRLGHFVRRNPVTRLPAPHGAWWLVGVVCCAVAAASTGCNGVMTSFLNSFLDPSQVGSYGLFGKEGTLDIRSSLTLQDAPTGLAGVTDPQPEDLVPLVEEYRYQIGDALTVRVYELIQRGTETAVQATIDETGSISLPLLGRTEVVGLTLPEIEAEIVDQLVRRRLLVDPEVLVEPAVRRGLSYTIYGTINSPNLYPLAQYNLRLLEAINIAGGLLDSVTEVYVVRSEEQPEPVLLSDSMRADRLFATQTRDGEFSLSDGYTATSNSRRTILTSSGTAPSRPAGVTAAAGEEESLAPASDSGARTPMIDTPTSGTGVHDAQVEPTPATPSAPLWIYRNGEWVEVTPEPEGREPSEAGSTTESPPPADEARQEIIDSMVGEPITRQVEEPAATGSVSQEGVAATPSQPRWIYYNGKWIESEAVTTGPAESAASKPFEIPAPAAEPAIDWSQMAGVQEHRVIKIGAGALREGDPRQNIVIRPGDAVRLASGEFGEYYVMGQVIRPGAYSLTGRVITLKTAIASAGNLAPLAWPQHCTVYRRLGDREQMIQVNLDAVFAGKEQDFFIKKDDLVLVGTHPVAPFLAVLRNAFRATYGFGFVYDRNYADIDAYTARINPDSRVQRALFPNLFPQQF